MKAASPTSLTVLCCALLLPTAWAACGSTAEPPVVGTPTAGSSSGGNGSGTAGSQTSPTSGADSGGAAPTAGSSTGTSGAASTGSGGMSVAGASGSTSNAGSSQGGSGVVAGSGGAAAGSTSSAGAGGVPSGGAGGAPGDLLTTVGGPLDGQMMIGPCKNDTSKSVCQTSTSGCKPANKDDPALSGELTTDRMVKLGGDPAKVYTITLHVQGVVESKRYTNGKDQEGQMASPKMDGFCEGGTPSTGDQYNVYMIRVSSPKKDYFLNSLQTPGVSNHTTYGIDYTAKIQANGGAELRLVAGDANCSMIKNCGPTENNGSVCTAPITLANVDPKATAKNPTFNFNTAYNGQWITMVVTSVVAN